MLRPSKFYLKLTLSLMLLASSNAFGGPEMWYTTHGVEKFPCMNEKESDFLKRIVDMQKIEQKLSLLADHRKMVTPSSRRPASVNPDKLKNAYFICPPFKGVRNPYPQVVEFGKASTFERIRLTESTMDIVNGLSKNERWKLNYNKRKGYYEGESPRGTPTNLIPLPVDEGQEVRFLVQYLLWKDKTPPSLTLCYRQDLHRQCNPYADPALKKLQAPPVERQPASTAKVPKGKS